MIEDKMYRVGSSIRKIRELRGFSPKDMAAKLEMSLAGYSKIERGEVEVGSEKIKKISELLEVTSDQLLHFDERILLNNSIINPTGGNNAAIFNNYFPIELKKSYEENIATQKKTIAALEAQIVLLMK